MATLTSTGAVNLTSSTNWSPAQIPAAGDDLVIAAHTLTLDADFTGAGAFNTVTFNNTLSRLAISGTTRSVQATNGWFITASLTSTLCTTAISSGISVTLTGKWTMSSVSNSTAIAQGTGGDLTLQTVGASQSNVLFESLTNAIQTIVSSWTSGTLTTIGRLDGSKAAQPTSFVAISGGQWTHQSVGYNYVGTGSGRLCNVSGVARITWTGSVDSISTTGGGSCFSFTSSDTGCSIGQSGDVFVQRATISNNFSVLVYHGGTGTVSLVGKFVSKNKATTIGSGGGTIQYRNQSVSIASDESLVGHAIAGTLDFSGLVISNAGKVAFLEAGGSTIVASAGTSITNTTSSAQAAVYSTAFDGKIITLPSPAPTLPAVQDVAAGTSYGYAASPLTGTGIINDPAVLASSLRAGIGMASANMDTQLNAILAQASTIQFDETRPTIMAKDSSLRWTIYTRNRTTGVLTDADSTPTVAVRKNGAASAETVTVTKRSATTGIYDCSFNPTGEVDGDVFELAEASVVSGVTFENTFTVSVPPTLSVTIDPLVSTIRSRISAGTITLFVGESIDLTIEITDSAGDPVDLTTKNPIVVFEDADETDLASITSFTISGANNNNITFTVPSAVTQTVTTNTRPHLWSLRDQNDGDRVLGYGTAVVKLAALQD